MKRSISSQHRKTRQDFYEIRDTLLAAGELFEDQDFPANDHSIYFSKRPPREYVWKRPKEVTDNPQMFVDGSSRFDVRQGEIGDCWLLAALANLTLNDSLFEQVVPNDQGFGENYAGIFHFRFWKYGKWLDVVVDDRLPTFRGQLSFLHSVDKNEFWSALLEKAYAKLHGSYEALNGGAPCDAMVDFTAGVTEIYTMAEAPKQLDKILMKAFQRSSLMGCSINRDPENHEAHTETGLIKGHAYSITGFRWIETRKKNLMLVRLRNPWGNDREWNGDWSDKSSKWKRIPDEIKEEMCLTFEHDGEFWMSYADFTSNFDVIEICNLSPDSLVNANESRNKKRWNVSMFKGEWVKGISAGGCRNSVDDFVKNSQYHITLEDPDEDDDEVLCTVIVALLQKSRQRKFMGLGGARCLTIGFTLYHLPNPESLPTPLDRNFFCYHPAVEPSPTFLNTREVSYRYKLPPGTYCIVPSTFHPHEEGKFVLRVFSEAKNNMKANDEEVGLGDIDERVSTEKKSEKDEYESTLKKTFFKIAGDDMEVGWEDLQVLLGVVMEEDEPSFDHTFSKDVCRSMVALMDDDRSGQLGFSEFKVLWREIRNSREAFKLYDQDNLKSLSAFELRQALNSAGYRLNNHVLNILAHRYSTKDGMITFDDFIMCTVRLKAMIDAFKERDTRSRNKATFSMDDWIERTMYS